MAVDPGLQQEQRCWKAALALQRGNWNFKNFSILKAVRTYGHPDHRIREFDGGKKTDLIILFLRRGFRKPLAFLLQVKSTQKSYKRFRNSGDLKKKHVKCIWVFPREPLKYVMADLDRIFREALSRTARRRFLRRNLSAELIKIICDTP